MLGTSVSMRAVCTAVVLLGATLAGVDARAEERERSGFVLDTRRLPVGQATVEWVQADGTRRKLELRNGKFKVPLSPHAQTELAVSAPGYLPRTLRSPFDSTGVLSVILLKPEAITGVVVDAKGRPVQSARIRLKRHAASSFPTSCTGNEPMTAITDAQGRFDIDRLEPGRHTFRVGSADHPRLEGEVVVPSWDLRWALPAGVPASIRVRDAAGEPVKARVILSGPPTQQPLPPTYLRETDASGGGSSIPKGDPLAAPSSSAPGPALVTEPPPAMAASCLSTCRPTLRRSPPGMRPGSTWRCRSRRGPEEGKVGDQQALELVVEPR